MESALWIFRGSSFHNLAAEVPKRLPNRMDLFLYGTSNVNAVDRRDILGTNRTDRSHKTRGGLITLFRNNITFTTTDIPSTINTHNTELKMVKVHNNNT